MISTKRLLVMCVIALFSAWYWPSAGGCSPTPTYTISESELQTLESHLLQLEQNNNALVTALSASEMDSASALKELTEARQELTLLRLELTRYRKEAESASESLTIAQDELNNALKSLKESEAAHARTENRLRNQRTAWQIIALILGGVAVTR